MTMYLLLLILLSPITLYANDEICVHSTQGYPLYYRSKQWEVEREGRYHTIQRCFVEKALRDLPQDKVEAEKLLEHFAIRVTKMSDGKYAMRAHVRGRAGGPITAEALYWLTKIMWHGAADAAAALEATEVFGTPFAGTAALGALTTISPAPLSKPIKNVFTKAGAPADVAIMAGVYAGPLLNASAMISVSLPMMKLMKRYNTYHQVVIAIGALSKYGGGVEATGEVIATYARNVGMGLPLP